MQGGYPRQYGSARGSSGGGPGSRGPSTTPTLDRLIPPGTYERGVFNQAVRDGGIVRLSDIEAFAREASARMEATALRAAKAQEFLRYGFIRFYRRSPPGIIFDVAQNLMSLAAGERDTYEPQTDLLQQGWVYKGGCAPPPDMECGPLYNPGVSECLGGQAYPFDCGDHISETDVELGVMFRNPPNPFPGGFHAWHYSRAVAGSVAPETLPEIFAPRKALYLAVSLLAQPRPGELPDPLRDLARQPDPVAEWVPLPLRLASPSVVSPVRAGSGVKDRKFQLRGALAALRAATWVVANVVTESDDVLECAHKALPKAVKRPVVGRKSGKAGTTLFPPKGENSAKALYRKYGKAEAQKRMAADPAWKAYKSGRPVHQTPQQMAKEVYNNLDKIDEQKFAECVGQNIVTDFVVGKAAQAANRSFLSTGIRSAPVGIGAGSAL